MGGLTEELRRRGRTTSRRNGSGGAGCDRSASRWRWAMLVMIFYVATLVRLGGNVMNRPL